MLKTRERILTIQELATDTQIAVTNAQVEPVVVTADGHPAAYLVSVELFDAFMAHATKMDDELLENSIAIATQQFGNGNFKTFDEAVALIKERRQAKVNVE